GRQPQAGRLAAPPPARPRGRAEDRGVAARVGAEAGPRRAPCGPPGRRGHPRGSRVPQVVPRPQPAGGMTPLPLDQAVSETTMKGPRENRSSRPTDPWAGPKPSKKNTTVSEHGGAHQTEISVQCPNPACGKTYTVRSSYAGKKGRCRCGAVFHIPSFST